MVEGESAHVMEYVNVLSQELRPQIERQETRSRMPIGVEKRVMVTIWKLATNVEYRTLSVLFGLGRSTVCVIVVETCNAIAKHLFPRYVSFPTGERLRDIVSMFETCWGFPQGWLELLMGHLYVLCVPERVLLIIITLRAIIPL